MKKLSINVKLARNVEKEILEKELKIKKETVYTSQIFENIYLSGCQAAMDKEFLTKNYFSHIINSAGGSSRYKPVYFDDFKYLIMDIKDDPDSDILLPIFSTIEFIENALNCNGKVLIHCFEGISRAPALLASYLMWKFNWNKEQAINFLKEKREVIDINIGFLYQLEKWGEFIFQNRNKIILKFTKNDKIIMVNKLGSSDIDDSLSIIIKLTNKIIKLSTGKNNNDNIINSVNRVINLLFKGFNNGFEVIELDINNFGVLNGLEKLMEEINSI